MLYIQAAVIMQVVRLEEKPPLPGSFVTGT
jgi:hypothetical protein